MISIVIRDLEYKGVGGFEDLRDEIYRDSMIDVGCISANYSSGVKVGIFVFISFNYIPERLQKYAKTYHPVTEHTHGEG